MRHRNSQFIFKVVTILFLNALLFSIVGTSPVAAAGIDVTINQSVSGPVQNDPTNKSPIVFQVIFSQAVADFGPGDVDLSGSTGGGAGLSYTIGGSGAVYSVSVTGMTSGMTVVASILADVVSAGAATNTASTSTDNSVYYETVKPTVTINQAAGQADPTNAAPILYTAVFSEAVTGFDPSDINITGTAPGIKVVTVIDVAPNNGTTYQVSVTGMTGSGTVIAAVKPNAAQDAAGNWSVGSTSTDKTVTYNVTPPTVTINQSPSGPVQLDPTKTSPIVFEVIFSAPVTGFAASDVDFSGSTGGGIGLSCVIAGSGPAYSVSVTGMVSGDTVVAAIPASAATDLAGNANAASTSADNSVLYDSTPPTVTINQAVGQVDPASAQPVAFTAVFSENVTGFDAADVTVGGSALGVKTVSIIPVDAKTYTVQVSGMTGRGTVSVSVKSNAAQDTALNWSAASTSTDNEVSYKSALVVDTTVDKDSGACVQGNCSLREAIAHADSGDTITFSLAYPATITLASLINFDRDLTISGPGADKLIVQGAGSDRIFTVQTTRTVAISGLTIFAGFHATQGGGIHNGGFLTLDRVVLNGNDAPAGGAIYNNGTLTITNSTLSGNQATSGAAIYNAKTLSVTNSTLGDNTATGQAGGIYNTAGATATLLHTSIVDNPGGGFYNAGTLNYTSTVIAKNGGSFGDCLLAGAGSLGTNLSNFVGNASCSASLSGDPLVAALGSKPNEPIDTFALFSGSPLLDVANAGTCPATDQRGATRPFGAGCDIGSFEGNRPSVTVNQAVGQADPTASDPILFTVVFGDPVTGFDLSDVVISGTAAGTLTPVVTEVAPNNGTTYQISVSGMTGSGTVIATINDNAAQNAQGNDSGKAQSTDRTVTYDTTPPTVTINQNLTGPVQMDPTNVSPIVFQVAFSEAVTGFTASDISFVGSTNPGALSATVVMSSAPYYVVSVTGMASGDTVVVSIPANAATDLAGNNSAASTSTDNSVLYETTKPTVTIDQAGTQVDPASTQPVVFTVIFSEAVTGFDAADVVLSGTAGGTKTVTIVMIDAMTYRVEITGITTGGTVIARVRPNAAQDAALNWSMGSTSTDNVVTFTP